VSARGPRPAPMHRATVAPHRVARWIIASCEIEVPAVSIDHARRLVVAEAHRRANVPPMKPLVRASWPFSSAEPVAAATVDGLGGAVLELEQPEPSAQLDLEAAAA